MYTILLHAYQKRKNVFKNKNKKIKSTAKNTVAWKQYKEIDGEIKSCSKRIRLNYILGKYNNSIEFPILTVVILSPHLAAEQQYRVKIQPLLVVYWSKLPPMHQLV